MHPPAANLGPGAIYTEGESIETKKSGISAAFPVAPTGLEPVFKV